MPQKRTGKRVWGGRGGVCRSLRARRIQPVVHLAIPRLGRHHHTEAPQKRFKGMTGDRANMLPGIPRTRRRSPAATVACPLASSAGERRATRYGMYSYRTGRGGAEP